LIPGGYGGTHEKTSKTKCPALWWKKSFASLTVLSRYDTLEIALLRAYMSVN